MNVLITILVNHGKEKMMSDIQQSIFDYIRKPFKIDKPIRLVSLFSGYDSQAMALRRLGVDFEHYRAVEFDKYAIASLNAVHGTNFEVKDIKDVNADDLGIVERDKYCYIMTYSAPCALACSTKSFPSKCSPLSATNTQPEVTFRLSVVTFSDDLFLIRKLQSIVFLFIFYLKCETQEEGQYAERSKDNHRYELAVSSHTQFTDE